MIAVKSAIDASETRIIERQSKQRCVMVSCSCRLDHRSASLLDGRENAVVRTASCRNPYKKHVSASTSAKPGKRRRIDGEKTEVRTVIQMSHECQEKDDASAGKLRCLQPFRDPFTFFDTLVSRETTPPSDTLLVTPR